jgi:hypothetical protein
VILKAVRAKIKRLGTAGIARRGDSHLQNRVQWGYVRLKPQQMENRHIRLGLSIFSSFPR